jgi:hypothetical protein
MKRLFKFLINLILALVAVGLTLIVLFFVTPSWQKSVVEEALSRDTARKWQVGKVNIQPAVVEVENVYVLDGQVGAGMKYIRFDAPLWKLALTGELDIESGSVIGLDLDVSKVKVGDLTSEDYQGFLKRVSSDLDFWKERVALVLSKFAASGVRIHLRNVQINGRVLMPGEKSIPLKWIIVDADSQMPRLIKLEPMAAVSTLNLK